MGCVNSPSDLLENSPNSGSELWLVSAELASVCVYVEAAEQRLQLVRQAGLTVPRRRSRGHAEEAGLGLACLAS